MKLTKGFTPNWFTVSMGTGILALDSFILPHSPSFLKDFGTVLWVFNIIIFSLFTLLLLGRWIVDPQGFKEILHHPTQSMFFGAVPMALTTIVNGLIDMGPRLMGAGAYPIALYLWIANAVIAAASLIVVPYYMMTRHDHGLDRMTGIWLLPIVPGEVVAASGGILIPHLVGSIKMVVLFSSMTLWSLSVPLGFLLLGILFLRLVVHQLPAPEMAISTWISLGTIGTGVMGLLGLGSDFSQVVPTLGTVMGDSADLLALVLWGFGLWWLVQSILLTLHYLRHKTLPFNLGWWGLTFPLGVFTGGTDGLYGLFPLSALNGLAVGFYGLLAAFWIIVASRTAHMLWRFMKSSDSTTREGDDDEDALLTGTSNQ